MPRRWEFRWSLGCVPAGTIFPGGAGHGVTPDKHCILLPMSPPISTKLTAQGIAQLEAHLIREIRSFMGALRTLPGRESPAEFYSAYEVQS